MRTLALFLSLCLLSSGWAAAEDLDIREISIKDHRFQPERLEVPADKKFKLIVKNQDSTAEEFESFALNREKIVPPGGQIPVFLGPLAAGEYKVFGDFHQDTAQGVLVAR